MKNNFVCKSITLANYLIEKGSNILRIDKDKNSQNYLVFIFKQDNLLEINLKNFKK